MHNDYYPFGLTFNEYQNQEEQSQDFLYNGKELQTDLGLDWYDYGARMYDASIGRWHVVDPMNEVYYSNSPYNYTLNNPINFIDPNGTLVYDWDSEEYKDDDGNTVSNEDAMRQIQEQNGSSDNGEGQSDSGIDLLDGLINTLKTWTSQFSFTDDKDKLYSDFASGDQEAKEKIAERENSLETLNTINNTSPYVALSVGKQTSEGSFISFNGTLIYTVDGFYVVPALDASVGLPAVGTKASLSLSAGVIFGSRSGIPGVGSGYGYGSFVGLEYGKSSDGGTKNVGLVLTNTPLWFSGNVGYGIKLNK